MRWSAWTCSTCFAFRRTVRRGGRGAWAPGGCRGGRGTGGGGGGGWLWVPRRVWRGVLSAAAAYCERRRAMLIVDPPKDWTSAVVARAKIANVATDYVGTRSRNAALYFPRLRRDGGVETFAPSGAIAGVIAKTDAQRG